MTHLKRINCIFFLTTFLVSLIACTQENDYTAKGEMEEKNGNYGNAIKYYKRALSKQPKNIQLYYKIGKLYDQKLLDDKEALKIYLEGVEQFPNDFDLNVYTMQIYFELDEEESGLRFYDKIAKLRGPSDSYYLPRKIIERYKQKLGKEELEIFCKNLITKNPSDIIVRDALAKLYMNEGKALEARTELEAIVSYNGGDGYVYFDLALCNFNLGEYKKALSQFEKAEDLGVKVPPKYIEAVKKKTQQ